MDLESSEAWRILWVVAAGVFIAAEMLRRLRLWFLPFAIGALTAAAAAFAGVGVPVQGAFFVAVSMVALLALRPVSRLLRLSSPDASVGATRWMGRQASVEIDVPPRGEGWVLLGRERWRAESGIDVRIPAGSTVLVTGVEGTHLTVLPLEFPETTNQSTGPRPEGV